MEDPEPIQLLKCVSEVRNPAFLFVFHLLTSASQLLQNLMESRNVCFMVPKEILEDPDDEMEMAQRFDRMNMYFFVEKVRDTATVTRNNIGKLSKRVEEWLSAGNKYKPHQISQEDLYWFSDNIYTEFSEIFEPLCHETLLDVEKEYLWGVLADTLKLSRSSGLNENEILNGWFDKTRDDFLKLESVITFLTENRLYLAPVDISYSNASQLKEIVRSDIFDCGEVAAAIPFRKLRVLINIMHELFKGRIEEMATPVSSETKPLEYSAASEDPKRWYLNWKYVIVAITILAMAGKLFNFL